LPGVRNQPKLPTIEEAASSIGGKGAESEARRRYHDRRENPSGGGKTMRDLSGTEHLATQAVWAGEEYYLVEGATQVPIVQSIPFGYADLDEWMGVALGDREGHIYSRNTNPTTRAFEEKVRALEGGGRTRRVSQPGWRSSVTPCSPS
jgi:Cys/Met metabolism PLP-dependent enzyme